jgi:hypothetical protein
MMPSGVCKDSGLIRGLGICAATAIVMGGIVRARSAGMLPWQGFDRVQPNGWFFRGSNVESMHWMVLHRPVDLARLFRT